VGLWGRGLDECCALQGVTMEPSKKNKNMLQQPDEEQRDGQSSTDFLGQKEFFSLIAKLVGFLIGAAGLFMLFGYTITFSFISSLQLSGLTSFQQEFYKDVVLTFVADIFKSYAEHPVWFVALFVLISEMVYLLFKSRQKMGSVLGKTLFMKVTVGAALRWLAAAVLIAVIAATLNLNELPDKYRVITDIRKLVLFVLAMPSLVLSFLYLVFKFNEFIQQPFRYYYFVVLLCLGLLVSIPVSYGENIFNIDLFHIVGIDYDAKNDSLDSLKQDINTQGGGELFYFMGNTSDRDVIIDNHALSPPLKIILVDRSLVKYLRISTKHSFTLKDLMMKEAGTFAVPTQTENLKKQQVKVVTEDLPVDIRALLNKE
jgi:hypothetical protein